MTRQIFLKTVLAVVAILGLLVFPNILTAQGNSNFAFDRVKEVQEAHTDALMARPGVAGTAIGSGPDGQLTIVVLLERPGIAGIPAALEVERLHQLREATGRHHNLVGRHRHLFEVEI